MGRTRIFSVAAGLLVVSALGAPASAIDLKPKSFPLKIIGVKVEVPVTISFDAQTKGDTLALDVRSQAELKDIQDKALDIARAIPMPRGNCDHGGLNPVVNSIDNAKIEPDGATAKISISGHVTAWLCEAPLKTTVGSDSVTLTASVEAIVVNEKQLALKLAGPVSVETGHELTKKAAKLLGVDVGAAISSQLELALDASEARASIPALPGLVAHIETAQFASNGKDLLIRATGRAEMTSATFNKLLESMMK